MRRNGKIGKKWLQTRTAFLLVYPPNHQGYYICYLCGRPTPANEITVDHIVARTRDPNLRFVFSNLAVCCSSCNKAKGSTAVKPQEEIEIKDDELQGLW